MLESRCYYGYYGPAGGVTGESAPGTWVRMPYREYKLRWAGREHTEYDPETKTIKVYFTDEEMAKKTNLGNRYALGEYRLVFECDGEIFYDYFRAKNQENAYKNARAWARKNRATFIGEWHWGTEWTFG